MPILFRDFETRSTLDLTVVGTWRYAADPTTDVWCVGYAVDDGQVEIWIPGQPIPEAFLEAARNPDWLVVAHNDQFERSIEELVLAPRYGWPLVPIERHRCTMAMALAAALPAKLEKVAEALGSPFRKDIEGQRLMRLMAKPRKPRPDEDPNGIYWHDEPEKRERLQGYCKRDVDAERDISKRVLWLSPDEQFTWQLDAEINRRGFYTDGPLLEAASRIAAAADQAVQEELARITDGALTSTDQVAALQAWLAEHRCEVKDIQKPTLKHALRRKGLDPTARRVIELRLGAAHAAADKVNKLLEWRAADGRVRGSLIYHGASTGRWSGFGPQPQNFKRDSEGVDAKIAAVMNGGGGLALPLEAVGDIARAMICATPRHRLLIGDFSGIESRVLAWAAEERRKLEQWVKFDRTGKLQDEPYYVVGLDCGLPEERARDTGKVVDLSSGFQIGWEKLQGKLTAAGVAASEEEARRYHQAWRNTHPRTVAFWRNIDNAAIAAVRQPGTTFQCKRHTAVCDQTFLRITLPSGRSLSYPFPRVGTGKFGNPAVIFKVNENGKWTDCKFGDGFYGGAWTENIISGMARDLLAAAMRRLEAAGYPIVLHVHDEIVCEVPDGFGSLEEFQRLITTLPIWAEGLPVAAKVRESQRFSKPSKSVAEMAPELPAEPEIMPAATVGEPEDVVNEPEDVVDEPEILVAEPYFASGPILAAGPAADAFNQVASMSMAAFGAADPEPGAAAGNGARVGGISWSTPSLVEVPPGSAEFEAILAALSPEDRAVVRPNGGNDQEQNQRADGNRRDQDAGGERFNGHNGNYGDRSSEQHAGKPYGVTRTMLMARGYRVTQTFPFQVPSEVEPRFFEDRWELKPEITASKERPRKTCRYWHRANGQELNDTGPRRIIYNWPTIMAAGPGANVFITEGANKSKPLNEKGLLATAAPYHQWGPECVAALAGQHLFYLEDTDHPDEHGHIKAKELATAARKKLTPAATSFRIVPGLHLWKNLGRAGEPPHGWDVKDWIEQGGDPAKLLDICREVPADAEAAPELDEWDAGELLNSGLPEPRQWLEGRQFCRRFLSGLVASGDVGKTTLRLTQAIGLATGRELIGHRIYRRCRVLVVSFEDDRAELHRRLLAICRHHNVDPAELKGWLFCRELNGVKLAQQDKGQHRLGPLDGMLRRAIERLRLDLIVLDPFVKLHALDENKNPDMDFVCTQLIKLAQDYNIAVDSPAHTHKGQIQAGDADARRGASAQRDAGRLDFTLTPMSEEEAKRFGIDPDERKSYVRLDRAKANLVRAIKAEWFKLVSVALDNATEEYPEGDNVQALETWTPPETWADLDPNVLNRILAVINAGLPDGNRYSDASNVKERAAWRVVVEQAPDKTEAQAREIIRTWVKNGVLVSKPYENPKTRKSVTGLYVDPGKRPT